MFEEEYNRLLELPEYQDMGDISVPFYQRASLAHDGYFSADKKKSKNGKEYFEEKDTKGNTNADNDTFNKIMRDKEKLLSFDEPLSFIFSHSALKEGWDNPNVFQICTLNETTSEMKKRQEIGRGLRIAVNQKGERVRGFDINTLTVMANESYEQFVDSLQKEMKDDENINFGRIESCIFANIVEKVENGEERYLGHEKSEELHKFLVENEYVDEEGNAKDKLKADLRDNRLILPQEFEHIRPAIEKKLKSSAGKLVIKNADDKKKRKINKEVFLDKNFSELWDKIKYKTTYKVNFDSNNLIAKCVKDIDDYLFIEDEKYIFEKKRLALTHGGIEEGFSTSEDSRIDFQVKYKLPDIITYLQNETNLTRKSIVEILTRTETLDSFKKNPQLYLEKVTDIIEKTMKNFIVDGIKYEKIGNGEFYSQDLFEAQELFGYLKDEMNKEGNMLASTKSPYENIVLDSDIERNFALELEKNKNVVIYTKLPAWFKIPTPLGNYNPDWAVLVRPDLTSPEQKLYFVVETKGSVFADDRRETENLKITCGKKHFKAISEDINFQVANDFEYFSSKF